MVSCAFYFVMLAGTVVQNTVAIFFWVKRNSRFGTQNEFLITFVDLNCILAHASKGTKT